MTGYCAQGCVIACFLLLNSTLNLAIKWSLGAFPYPLLLTASHMASTTFLLAPAALLIAGTEKQNITSFRQWKGICAVGATLALNISLNNTALLHMTLSLNQVIRSSMPIFTCLIAFPVEKKVPKPLEMVALVTLGVGIMTCVWRSDAAGTAIAMLLCLTATICNSAMSCFAGKIMSESLDALQAVYLPAPISLLVLLPFLISREMPALMRDIRAQGPDKAYRYNADLFGILIGTSFIAILYNIVHAYLIKMTSATTTTVVGQMKIVGILILSAALLGESTIFTLQMIWGIFLALVGFASYSVLKLMDKQNHDNISTDMLQDVPCEQKLPNHLAGKVAQCI